MGPSGYGYIFPANMSREEDRAWFADATIADAATLGMRGEG